MAYMGIGAASNTDGSQNASPMAFVADWSINFTVAKVDVTSMGDPNLIWVAGLPDASGDFTGFFDTATAQTYTAARDGLPRNFYLYPSTVASQGGPGNVTVDVGQYFYGTILPDFSVSGGVTSAVTMKSTWSAASGIFRYPPTGVSGT